MKLFGLDGNTNHSGLGSTPTEEGCCNMSFEADEYSHPNEPNSIVKTSGDFSHIPIATNYRSKEALTETRNSNASAEHYKKERKSIKNIKKILQRQLENDLEDVEKTGKEEISVTTREDVEAPDGGWGYVIIFGAFLAMFLYGVLAPSIGILFTDVLLEARTSATTITALFTVHSSLNYLGTSLTGFLTERWGWRLISLVGSLFCFSGLIITAFTSSMPILFFSHSIITGLGSGILYTVSMVVPNHYFKRRRGKANGIVLCGSTLGSIVGPLLTSYLKHQYGHRGATLILAALMLHCCISALVFHPVEWHSVGRGRNAGHSTTSQEQTKFLNILKDYWKALRTSQAILLVCIFFLNSGLYRGIFMLVPLVLEEAGYTTDDVAFTLSLISVCCLISRLGGLSLTDMPCVSVPAAFAVFLAIIIISLAAFSMVQGLVWMRVLLAVYGCGFGPLSGLQNLVIAQYMGLKNLTPILGAGGFASFVWQLSSSPLYGFIYSLSDNYRTTTWFLVIQVLLTLVLSLIIPTVKSKDTDRKEKSDTQDQSNRTVTTPL